MLEDSIRYADDSVLQKVKESFDLIDTAPWYELYKSREDGSLWRLDEADKYQEQFLVRVDLSTDWSTYDASPLQIALLERTRGLGGERCFMKDCDRPALNKLVY